MEDQRTMRGGTFLREYLLDVERTYSPRSSLSRALLGPLAHPGLRASLTYRLAHRLWKRRWLRPLAVLLRRFGGIVTGAEIHPAARIGGGLHLPHPTGVVIGPTVRIEGPATIFQQVTLGPRTANGDPDDGPRLEPYTFLYPGARVLGPVRIGARSQVGPNCVIYRDLPEGSTVLPPEPLVLEGLSFTLRFPTPADAAASPREPAEALP